MAVAITGTPVYLALKMVVCGASLAVAASAKAVIAGADCSHDMGLDQFGYRIAANCGPPCLPSSS